MDCKCCTAVAAMGNSYIVGLWRTICGSYDIAHRQWQSVVSTALLVGHTHQEYHSVCTHSPPGCRAVPLANGFGCTATEQYSNRCRLHTSRSLGASCSCSSDQNSCRTCCVALYAMCVRVCVVNSTRKILPWIMWLCSEKHTSTKEVEYVVVSKTH